ncbi:unnamed protein product [Eruca vesicaria subsp. sativa]|uniref:KIB1-4 beta-propeller domain-containing protein n=1 Tax=Eruca vesicaria subsp. sativa TaxID=29727 RepID=A0ABC8M7D8_ERUVS|nr:unnamed protein product [Eruca vesicaria subsp. sativa]
MRLLLSEPSKIYFFQKPVSVFVRSCPPIHSNGFSSSCLPQAPPCVIMYVDPCGDDLGKLVIRKAGDITPLEKPTNEMGTIGSSNGWLTTLNDGVIGFQDNDLNPKRISLPPLVTLPYCQTQVVTNVAMSSTCPEEEDCVVAVKFLGPQLSFFRPNSEWIDIRIQNPSFLSSHVMYSKKDDVFLIPGSGGHLMGSWDLKKPDKNPKFRRLRFRKIPFMSSDNKALLDTCCKSEHLVESRTTGEIFLVKLYKKTIDGGTARVKTEAVMVFKLDDKGSAVYTHDIGHLCIFITKSEPFCLPSTSFPDMYPNHVVILDLNETSIFNLADLKWNC